VVLHLSSGCVEVCCMLLHTVPKHAERGKKSWLPVSVFRSNAYVHACTDASRRDVYHIIFMALDTAKMLRSGISHREAGTDNLLSSSPLEGV
jgi:hypothetical protein